MTVTPTAPSGTTDSWSEVIGQEVAVAQLRAAVATPVHAYVFVGPRGSGKRAAARAFAAEILAAASTGDDADRHRRLALAEQHPDLVIVEPVGARITAEQARDIVRQAALSPIEGERKVLVLCEMHRIEQVGPIMLKTIEEPAPGSIFVILADEIVPDLVTIASRCVRIDFSMLADADVAAKLVGEGVEADAAREAAEAAGGDLGRARLLATDPRLGLRRKAWYDAPSRLDGGGAAAAVVVDELRVMIDDAQAPLEARHAIETAELDERVARSGERGSGRKDLQDRQKREVRRHRTDELRFGLAMLAGRYRDEMVAGAGGGGCAVHPRDLVAAVGVIQEVAEALVRNPNEALLLQALFVRMPALRE